MDDSKAGKFMLDTVCIFLNGNGLVFVGQICHFVSWPFQGFKDKIVKAIADSMGIITTQKTLSMRKERKEYIKR